MHVPRHGKLPGSTQRRINGESAGVHIRQQMREIALDGQQPIVFPEGIDQDGVHVVQPSKRHDGLAIQTGVIINKPVDDERLRAHKFCLEDEHHHVEA